MEPADSPAPPAAVVRRIRPYFALGWAVNVALRVLAGQGVLVSYALLCETRDKHGRPEKPRVHLDHVRALAAAGCDLVFDNGEFSRWKSGQPTDEAGFYAFLRLLDAERIPWTWAIAPDVIGDAEGTRERWRRILREQPDLVPRLVPVFHEGDPWDLLREYEPETRRVALGRIEGRKSKKATFEWYDECFNRHPDMVAHALGNASPETLEPYPFESFDATSWEQNAAFSNDKGWPFNRCTKETRMRAWVEAANTIEYRAPKQPGLRLITEAA